MKNYRREARRTAIHYAKHNCSKFCSQFCRHVVCDSHDVTDPLKRDDDCRRVTIFICPYLGCLCWVCTVCCAIYHHDEYEGIACRHHPRQAPERLDTVVAAVGSSNDDEIGDDLGLLDFQGEEEEEELFGSDWDPKDVPDQVQSLPDAANDVELDEALDVVQQDLQKEWDSSENPRAGPIVMNNDVVIEHKGKFTTVQKAYCVIQKLASEAFFLYPAVQGTRRVARFHSGRASEFTGGLRNHLLQGTT
eukprot:2274360-Amphidinium_carterae.1